MQLAQALWRIYFTGLEILTCGLKTNLGNVRNTTGAFKQMWYRPVISTVVNLVVSVILVQKYGIYGVVIGTLVADFGTNLLIDPYILHKYSFNNYKPVSVYYIKNIKINFPACFDRCYRYVFVFCNSYIAAGYHWQYT